MHVAAARCNSLEDMKEGTHAARVAVGRIGVRRCRDAGAEDGRYRIARGWRRASSIERSLKGIPRRRSRAITEVEARLDARNRGSRGNLHRLPDCCLPVALRRRRPPGWILPRMADPRSEGLIARGLVVEADVVSRGPCMDGRESDRCQVDLGLIGQVVLLAVTIEEVAPAHVSDDSRMRCESSIGRTLIDGLVK